MIIEICEGIRWIRLKNFKALIWIHVFLWQKKMISKTNKTVVLDASFPAKKIYIKRGYEPTEYNMIETENGDYLCFDVMEKSI